MEKEILNGLYFAKIQWYNDYKDTDEITCAFIIAKDYNDAMYKITNDFQYINSVTIDEIQPNNLYDIQCVYVPNNPVIINEIKKANDF